MRLREPAPLLDSPLPRDRTPLGRNVRVLRNLVPGDYTYTETIVGHDFMAYRLRADGEEGYVIHYSGVTEQCSK